MLSVRFIWFSHSSMIYIFCWFNMINLCSSTLFLFHHVFESYMIQISKLYFTLRMDMVLKCVSIMYVRVWTFFPFKHEYFKFQQKLNMWYSILSAIKLTVTSYPLLTLDKLSDFPKNKIYQLIVLIYPLKMWGASSVAMVMTYAG